MIKHRRMLLDFPVFHWTVEVVLTKDVVAYAKSRGWQGGRGEETTRGITMFYDTELLNVLVMQPNAEAGTIAHESWHCIRRMLLHVGADLDNETVAYHLGYIVQQITLFKNYDKRKKKVDKKKKS